MMSCPGGLIKSEGKGRRPRLHWALALAAVLALGIGCGMRGPDFGPGSEFGRGIRWAPGDASCTLRTVYYFKLMGQPEMALKELEEAHRLDPANLKLANVLAQSCDELGLGARAQQVYQEALALDPDNPVLLNNLGFSYYLAGNYSQAETYLRKTLVRQPDNQAARNNLGLLLCRQGRQEEARHLWQEAKGEAAAAQKLEEVLAVLGKVPETHYAQQGRSLPGAPITGHDSPQPSSLLAADAPEKIAPGPRPAAPTKLAAALKPKPPAPDSVSREMPASRPQRAEVTEAPPSPQKSAPSLVAGKRLAQPSRPRSETAAAPPPATASPENAPRERSGKATAQVARAHQPEPQGMTGKTAPEKTGITRTAPITARELMETNIAILNGNGISSLAHKTRSLLSLEGFNVVAIGNYLDFGMDRTVIYYRPDSEHVATLLNSRFFPRAEIKPAPQMAHNIDVKVILGHDLFPQQHAEAPQRDEAKRL